MPKGKKKEAKGPKVIDIQERRKPTKNKKEHRKLTKNKKEESK